MQDDLAKLQGTWHIVALEMDGQRRAAGNGAKVVVKGDRFTSIGMGADYKGKLVLNASDKPKAFDLKFTSGPEKGNTNLGIYELKGDRWKICLDFHGKGRPERFATKPGSGRAVEVLERAPASAAATPKGKAKATGEVTDLPANPAPELEGAWAMLSCVQNGEPMPQAWLRYGKRTAVSNLITVTMNKQVMLKVYFSVDRSKEPKEIDYIIALGPQAGQRQYGIYRLEGEKLTTAIAALGNPRPSDFSSAAGDGKLVTSWVRTK
ncbi:MAG TPA: TIGR03067 domain-containing protein [Bryobacteraceae bacterium]|nr:TIGR03067 domain-containing protein [Bryobacteraceae bacterium]